MLRNYENSSLGNWILARNFLKILFWPLFLRVDCSQLQDASIKPLCRVCSQKLKFLWPIVTFFELSEYSVLVGQDPDVGCRHRCHTHAVLSYAGTAVYTLPYPPRSCKHLAVHCTLYTVHCTLLYTVHRTLYTAHCTPYTVQCTLCVHTLYTVYTLVHQQLYRSSDPFWWVWRISVVASSIVY